MSGRRCRGCRVAESKLKPHEGLVRFGPWWKLFRPLLCRTCRERLQVKSLWLHAA